MKRSFCTVVLLIVSILAVPLVCYAGLPVLLKGYVRDALTFAPIVGATVTVGTVTTSTLSNGSYVFSISPGQYIVSASQKGYVITKIVSSANAGTVVSNDFELVKPFNCSNADVTTIADFAYGIDMFLGKKPVKACGDINVDGIVTIDELQDFLTSFFGSWI